MAWPLQAQAHPPPQQSLSRHPDNEGVRSSVGCAVAGGHARSLELVDHASAVTARLGRFGAGCGLRWPAGRDDGWTHGSATADAAVTGSVGVLVQSLVTRCDRCDPGHACPASVGYEFGQSREWACVAGCQLASHQGSGGYHTTVVAGSLPADIRGLADALAQLSLAQHAVSLTLTARALLTLTLPLEWSLGNWR